MKNVLLIVLLLFFNISIFAQSNFKMLPSKISSEEDFKLSKSLSSYKVVNIDTKSIFQYVSSKQTNINLDIFIEGEKIEILLEENNFLSPRYKGVQTHNGTEIEHKIIGSTYKGNIKNKIEDNVRLFISPTLLQGYVYKNSERTYIEPMATFFKTNQTDNRFIVFKDSDIKNDPNSVCGITAIQQSKYLKLLEKKEKSLQLKTESVTTNCKILEVATDADYEWFQTFGNNSNSQILNILNQVDALYQSTFNIKILVVYQNVYTSNNDPYNATTGDNSAVINEVKTFWNANLNIKRDLVHMFSGKALPLSTGGTLYGEASSIGNICSDPSNSYSFTVNRVDQFLSTAHEIGHNFSAVHPNTDPNDPESVNCGTSNASVMCQGVKKIPPYFSQRSISIINSYVQNGGCLYILDNSSISGPTTLCQSSNGNYSVSNLPFGATVSWSSNSNSYLSFTNPNIGQATTYNNSGNVPIYATINTSGCSYTISKVVTVGIPYWANVSYNGIPAAMGDGANTFSTGSYVFTAANSGSGAITHFSLGAVYPANGVTGFTVLNNTSCQFTVKRNDVQFEISFNAANGCGTASNYCQFSNHGQFIYSVVRRDTSLLVSYNVYPNPANEVMTVTTGNNLTMPLEHTSKQVKLVNGLDKVLWQGTMSNEDIDIPTHRIENGIYYLKIEGEKPSIIRVIIQH